MPGSAIGDSPAPSMASGAMKLKPSEYFARQCWATFEAAEGSFDINTVMAGILVLTAFALALDAGVGRIERRLMRWQPAAGETEKL